MKLTLVTCLVLIKFTVYKYCKSEYSAASEKLVQKPCDPKELLSNAEQEIIDNLPADKKKTAENWFIKNAMEKQELQKRIGFHSFECASHVAKGIMDYFHKPPSPYAEGYFRGIFVVPLFEVDECSHETLPVLYQQKFEKLVKQVQDRRYTNLERLTKVFRQWYCALSRNTFPVLRCINEKLQNYHKNAPEFGNEDFSILSLNFSASVAVSHRVFDYINYEFLPISINSKYVSDGSDDEFVNYLLTNWQYYTLSVQDISFLNILLSCRSPRKNTYHNHLKYVEVKHFKRNDELVAIPLSDKCFTQLFSSTSFDDRYISTTASKSN